MVPAGMVPLLGDLSLSPVLRHERYPVRTRLVGTLGLHGMGLLLANPKIQLI
jgi:hypothetical protein